MQKTLILLGLTAYALAAPATLRKRLAQTTVEGDVPAGEGLGLCDC